ncbi:MAG: hypothetical protein ABIP38_03045 [Steroidobacteraceae bacterium]
MGTITQTDQTPAEVAEQRRRVRRTALKLALFAFVVYVGFIVAFVNQHQ